MLIMGCYGIGVSRLMGTIAEVSSDDKGLVWPTNVAPFRIYLANVGRSPEANKAADDLYDDLRGQGIEVLYDDRDARAGEKFADADLLGIPLRIVVSDKLVVDKKFELKARTSDAVHILNHAELLSKVTK